MKIASLVLLLIGLLPLAAGQCLRSPKKKGCFWERKRAGVELLNLRYKIDWYNFSGFVESLVCRCEHLAKEKGFRFFAIRFYGVCVGLNVKEAQLENKPRVSFCQNTKYKQCDDSSDQKCVGSNMMEYVYEVDVEPVGLTCSFKKYGCYQEQTKFGKLIFNDRHKIDWVNYEKFIDNMACRCEGAARNEGFDYFAVRYWGVCIGFSSKKQLGSKVSGGRCRNVHYKRCNDNDDVSCVGANRMDYVYVIGRDGGYTQWSSWSACEGACGKKGVQVRTRSCTNPTPRGNGKDCESHKKETQPCTMEPCKVNGGFSEWSSFSACSATCGGGFMKRERQCNNPIPRNGGKDCTGNKVETKGCKNDLCAGTKGVAKAQTLVENFLTNYHKTAFPGEKQSGKFAKAIFAIQKTVADAFESIDPTTKKDVDVLLEELKNLLIVATQGGSVDFARKTLGKSIFAFIKKKIKEGLPIDEMSKASKGYLKWIQSQIGSNNFTKIISGQGAATLMFAIDTTGSMAEEINAAKGIAKSIIEETRKFSVDYILSPFNDPSVGPVIYKSDKQRNEVVSEIDKLVANGGGDCPELSVGGMLAAFDRGPAYGSPMYVFTDANAKDSTKENIASLKAIAQSNGGSITFFVNQQGCGGGIPEYKDIAISTGGQVFPLSNDKDILKFTEYVKTSLQRDTVIASGGSLSTSLFYSTSDREHQFQVDDGIQRLIVAVSTTNPNTAQQVQLMRVSDGQSWPATSSVSMACIFQLSADSVSGFVGKWKLVFPSSVGRYKYNVQAVSKRAIEFDHSFEYKINSQVHNFKNPVKGRDNKMTVRLGGVDNMDETRSFTCQLVDVSKGGVFVSGVLNMTRIENAVYSTQVTPPDAGEFNVQCKGYTKAGSSFERTSNGVSQPATLFMRAVFAGNLFSVPLSTQAKIGVRLFSSVASQRTLVVTAKSTRGIITPSSQTSSFAQTIDVEFAYTAPTDTALKGKVDYVTVLASDPSTGEDASISFEVLLF